MSFRTQVVDSAESLFYLFMQVVTSPGCNPDYRKEHRNMKKRNLKVYGMSNHKYEPTATIILRGKWLESLHFNIGDYVTVSCEDGKLVITPDTERVAMEKAEAEFMERETKALQARFAQEKARLHELFVAEQKVGYGV